VRAYEDVIRSLRECPQRGLWDWPFPCSFSFLLLPVHEVSAFLSFFFGGTGV
jgi:hypothetical protein